MVLVKIQYGADKVSLYLLLEANFTPSGAAP